MTAPPTKNPSSFWNELFSDRVQLLSVFGSASSIIALGLVFLDKISTNEKLAPEVAGWRVLFIILSFFGAVTIAIFTYQWARDAFTNGPNEPHRKTARIGIRIALGLLLIGFCMDGFFSAVYWTPWLSGLPLIIRQFRYGIGL